MSKGECWAANMPEKHLSFVQRKAEGMSTKKPKKHHKKKPRHHKKVKKEKKEKIPKAKNAEPAQGDVA